MEGVTIIKDIELQKWRKRLDNIEANQLALMKLLQQLVPQENRNGVPGYIAIKEACLRYKVSHVTVNNKIKLFAAWKGRPIDRLKSGSHHLINEHELQEALRLRGGNNYFNSKASE